MESLDARSEFVEAIESRSLHGTEWYCLPRFRQPELKVGISRILRRVCQEYGYDGRQFADGPTVDSAHPSSEEVVSDVGVYRGRGIDPASI